MIEAVIFDLDGVIVSTDTYHYLAWKSIANALNVKLDSTFNNRLRGVSREECLNILLFEAGITINNIEYKKLLERKNNLYIESLNTLTEKDILPGVTRLLMFLIEHEYKIAIGSSSKNAIRILEKIKLTHSFHCIITGNDITKTKPHPDVFLEAAKCMKVNPEKCLVIEDSDAGIEAAKNANMYVLGVNEASKNKNCDFRVKDLADLDYNVVFI